MRVGPPMRIITALSFAALATGCRHPAPPPPAAAPPSTAKQLVAGAGDVDGKPGDETLTLTADGTLTAGALTARIELTDAAPDGYFMSQQASLSVANIGRHGRVVVVGLPTGEEEDPPTAWQLFVPDGSTLRRIWAGTLGAYGPTDLRFPGDDTVRYTEDGWTSCDGAGDGTRPIHEVTLGWKGDVLVVQGRAPTGATQACDQLAACPWVYVDGVKVGEILRNLRGKAAYAAQPLALPAAAPGVLRVRVAEEEDEVTFLDEIWVEADGVRLEPLACAATAPPAYCAADHVPLRMVRGDAIELEFALPTATTPTVIARGYYIPKSLR